jgi:hypothetical protein
MEFEEREIKIVENLINKWNKNDIDYVIPRGHYGLPNSIPGGDLDFYVRSKDWTSAISVARSCGFRARSFDRAGPRNLIKVLLENPIRASIYGIKNTKKAFNMIINELDLGRRSENVSAGYGEWVGIRGNIVIHLMNHLAYTSPMNGSMIRVNPIVEEDLFNYSQIVGGLKIPSEVDEYVHLLCRGIFKYDGKFPDYYKSRLEYLKGQIFNDAENYKRLQKLINLLFFDASDLVIHYAEMSLYDDIKAQLIAYSDY